MSTADSVVSGLGSSFLSILEKLLGTQDIVHRGATVYYKSSEIEYTYQISIGPSHSRVNGIVKKLKGYLSQPVEFDDVIEIYGFGLPHHEDLEKLGIIQLKGKKAHIDFTNLFHTIKSELVTIVIRKKFPEGLKRAIVIPHMVQTSKYIGIDYTETNLEVALDYADLWFKSFEQFTIREIEFGFNLNIVLESIVSYIPKSFGLKFIHAAKMAKQGNQNALQFLKLASDKLLTFQNEKRIKEMLKTISVQPEQNFRISNVNPTMQSCEIAGVGYPITLPGQMKITLEGRVERREVALNGVLRVDLKKFGNIVKDIFQEIEQDTKALSF